MFARTYPGIAARVGCVGRNAGERKELVQGWGRATPIGAGSCKFVLHAFFCRPGSVLSTATRGIDWARSTATTKNFNKHGKLRLLYEAARCWHWARANVAQFPALRYFASTPPISHGEFAVFAPMTYGRLDVGTLPGLAPGLLPKLLGCFGRTTPFYACRILQDPAGSLDQRW